MVNAMHPKLSVGLSLKSEHFDEAFQQDPTDGLWYEVHSENYAAIGGPRRTALESFSSKFALSFHGVGANLGGKDPLNTKHLQSIARLVKDFDPALVSEHAVWSSFQGDYLADLLPLPRTSESLNLLVERIDQYQEAIGRSILLENPSNYANIASEYSEVEWLSSVARRSGCGLLVDLNNLYVSQCNVGVDAQSYIEAINGDLVGEIHIAGCDEDPLWGEMMIDSHASAVREPVWKLLEQALTHWGQKPILLERDGNVPAFQKLMAERKRALDLWQQAEAVACLA
jgi:uncharacterized protein (UPF0276 family)